MGPRRALACKLHLGEQLSSQSLHPGRAAGSSLLRPASHLLPVAQHVHQRAHEVLCELEGYNFTISDISTRTGDLGPISKGKGFNLRCQLQWPRSGKRSCNFGSYPFLTIPSLSSRSPRLLWLGQGLCPPAT